METPVSAFLKINRGGNSFLLESVEGGQRLARYSFIGTEPYRELTSGKKRKPTHLTVIAEELNKYKIVPLEGLPLSAAALSVISVMKQSAVLKNCHRQNQIH